MSVDLVTFNIRYEKLQFEFKMKSPSDVFHFIKTLKTELQIDDTVDIIILCPTSEGKMMEIKSNDDIAFLKKTKLSFNPESKEIYCNAELVLSVIYNQLPNDPKVQMMVLSNKIDQLTNQFEKLSKSVEHKIDEITNTLQNNIKLILAEHLSTNSGKREEINSIGEKQQNPKMNKKKLSSTSPHDILTTNDNLSKSYENINLEKKSLAINKKPTDIDSLLEMLAEDGFTNTIQNIIVLKRFDNDYKKVVEYLNNST